MHDRISPDEEAKIAAIMATIHSITHPLPKNDAPSTNSASQSSADGSLLKK